MLIDFLNITHSKEELATALTIIQAFKACESHEEWLLTPFAAWTKLEQLEEYLEHLVNGKPLQADTIAHMEGQEPA